MLPRLLFRGAPPPLGYLVGCLSEVHPPLGYLVGCLSEVHVPLGKEEGQDDDQSLIRGYKKV